MAFKQLIGAVALALAASAATVNRRATCADGTQLVNAECCALIKVRDDLQKNMFRNECGDEAHEALRLTFHDAIAISPALEAEGKFGGGGADGSIMIFSKTETAFHPNIGLDEVVESFRPFQERSGMGVADFIQFSGAVGTSNCPGAPVLNVSIGRTDATRPAPDGLVPEPFHDVDTILARFADAGEFDELETVWFLIAHSVAAQNDIDPTVSHAPFDSTPEIMDGQFFIETQLRGEGFIGKAGIEGVAKSPVRGEFRLQSDELLARDNRTACEWQSFGTDQAKLQNRFQFIFQAMGELGTDPTTLIDCSDVLPTPPDLTTVPHFPAGVSINDVQAACAETPFPTLPTDPGPATAVAPVPRD
uniref:Peroxidase n=2 Tax=Phlebia radiata TaxID=5308 RepID=Q3L2T9_PHLRA|nr:lignin peroxidase precursor [Phlebia radiata]